MTRTRAGAAAAEVPVGGVAPPGFIGWRIVAACVLIQTLISALFQQSYGVYASFWASEFGWTGTTIALVYSLHRTESALLGPVHGWLLQRFGAKLVVLTGILMLGAGFAALSFINGLAGFIGAYLLMAVGASLSGHLSLTTVLVNWFERHRSRALAMLAAGLSLGGLAIPLVTLALVAFGWRPVALASGVLLVLVGAPLARFMHRDPAALGMTRDGAPAPPDGGRSSTSSSGSITLAVALRSRVYWLLCLGHSCALAVVAALSVHFVLFAQARLDMEVTVAAAILTLSTATLMLGQLLGGMLGDRTDKRVLSAGGMLGHFAALVVLAVATAPWHVMVAMALHGLAWGMRGPLMSAMRVDYFGLGSFAMIMGTSSLVVTLGAVGGPLLVGILSDATGNYTLGMLVLALVALIGAWSFAALPSVGGTAGRGRDG